MIYSEIFHNKLLKLPKEYSRDVNFRSLLYGYFEDYLTLLMEVNPSNIQIEGLKRRTDLAKIHGIQSDFIIGLRTAIEAYFDGRPALAYRNFAKTMAYRKNKLKSILNISEFTKGSNFYRMRLREENYPFSHLEMFHVPFEKRGNVSTQRYSIPGFPSLYLASNLYVGWEELRRPKLEAFQAARLCTKQPIRYLDLTPGNWSEEPMGKKAYRYLMTWPLIAACSIKAKNHLDTFKPEYIVPQLLLQWIRQNNDLDGIKYISTHFHTSENKKDQSFFNLVCPVKDNSDQGYCSHLRSIFEISAATSWELIEIATGGMTFAGTFGDYPEYPKIEINKGENISYSISDFSKIERSLLDKQSVSI
jgi:hypothetical protein